MRNIERLFDGKRIVPGMHPRGKLDASLGAETIIGVPVSERADPATGPAPSAEAPTPQIIEAPRVRPGPELLYAHEPNSARSERVRLLRTHILLHHTQAGETNAVAVLGAGPGEGRSLVAAELALSLAQFNRPTLLVDVDFRKPRQQVLFGVEEHDGLAQAIAEHRAPRYHIVDGYANLALLTAGAPPENPLELLMDWRFENLMRDWQQDFDFIVLDTPPLNLYADALAVATVVGRVLLVYRASQTREKDAQEMLRRLAATNAEIIGGALNHF